jgi:hypothetical protein
MANIKRILGDSKKSTKKEARSKTREENEAG